MIIWLCTVATDLYISLKGFVFVMSQFCKFQSYLKIYLCCWYFVLFIKLEKMRQNDFLTKKMKLSSFPYPLLNPKSCSTWFFSQICSEGSESPRIIAIALFFFGSFTNKLWKTINSYGIININHHLNKS